MDPVNNTSSLAGVAAQIQADRRLDTDSPDGFSPSGTQAGQAISADSLFDAGTTIDEISSQILSCICEQGAS